RSGRPGLSLAEKPVSTPSYRWIIPAKNQTELKLRFSPPGHGTFAGSLVFELMRTKQQKTIDCRGLCYPPQISTEPGKIFSNCMDFSPSGKLVRKKFVFESGIFEFGPLLAGKSRERILAGDFKENVTELRFENDGLHDANVTFHFEDNDDCFTMNPCKFKISPGQTEWTKVFALPVSAGTLTSKLIGSIDDNPSPIVLQFSVTGISPTITVQT
uniref:ASH domain-containing protein n=1 Tax=Mesocestoides corti TaxID=53468 RepID=A0A5K3EYK1_MESCO